MPLDRLWLFTLNRVYNFAQVCPKQGIQFRASLGKSGVHILCPKQGYKIEGFVLFRIRVSNLRQPNLYPNIGLVPPRLPLPHHPCRYPGYQWFFLCVAMEYSGDVLSQSLVGVSSAKGWSYELPGYQSTDFYSPHPNILLSLLTGLTWCFTYVVLEWVSSCCPGKIPILKFEVCWDGYAGGLWPGGKSLRPQKFCLKKCTDQTV